MKLIYIAGIGFLTAWIGTFTGMISSYVAVRLGDKLRGSILSFIGGLMLSVVSFDLIPESIKSGNYFISVAGIIAGLIIAVIIEGRLEDKPAKMGGPESKRFYKAGLFIALAIGIHNMPAGIALGSLFYKSYGHMINLVIALVLHGIPEGIAFGVFLRESGAKLKKLLLVSVLTSISMGIGALTGGIVSKTSPVFTSFSLALAGGLIFYIIFEETLPEAGEISGGRLSTVWNILGVAVGILIISFLE